MADTKVTRRMLFAVLPIGLTGCGINRTMIPPNQMGRGTAPAVSPRTAAMYAAMPNERFPIPEVDFEEVEPEVLRRAVDYSGPESPGTIIIDTTDHALLLLMGGGQAIRYGVGVGKEGLAWSGHAIIGRKAEWPRWTPTKDMIAREPEKNAQWAGGMEPGLQNPLGARALYLYSNGRDTLYRIHGTNDPSSIGSSVSSGCIRMINQDVIDLYDRIPLDTPVIVKL
jgi:lipoprotein-anchoring transpeptidase ErfK/SrfK